MRAIPGSLARAFQALLGSGRVAVRLLERLPPRAAWLLWRGATVPAAALRRATSAPGVPLAAVAWGVDDYELRRLIERLSGAAHSPERVLLISDSDAVHLAASSGFAFEHVPPRRDWEVSRPGRSYEDFAASRVAGILGDRPAARIVAVGDLPPALAGTLPQAERLEPPPAGPPGG